MPFKPSTVPNFLLFIISFLVPSVFILLSEASRGFYTMVKRGLSVGTESNINKYRIQLWGKREIQLSETVGNIIVNLLYLSFGHLCNSVLSQYFCLLESLERLIYYIFILSYFSLLRLLAKRQSVDFVLIS